ncbi:hypothetical protein D770_05495 [Flammeovirgaceae bacterium 311]|nr:hypothetical protein D770_05495 [Flammeovirgaceae bacterium 311]
MEKANKFFDQGAYNSAYMMYTQVANDFKMKKDGLGYTMAMTGKAHASIGLRNFIETKFLLDSALIIGEKELGEHTELAQVYYIYGVYYNYVKAGAQALEMHDKALQMRRRLLGSDHPKVAESYNGIGEVYRYVIEDHFKAEEYFQRSADILHTQKDLDKKILFRAYYNLATTNRLIYDYDKALLYGLKSVETLTSLEEVNTTWLTTCYNMLANIYTSKKQPLQAIEYYQKAIDMRLSGGAHLNREIANGYNNLSLAYIETENYQEAIRNADKALNLLMNTVPFDTAKIVHSHYIKGKSYTHSNQFALARNSYQKCLQIQQGFSGDITTGVSNTYLHLSRLKKRAKEYDSALYFIQEAIQLNFQNEPIARHEYIPGYATLKDKPFLYRHLDEKGTILKALAIGSNDQKKWTQALDCFLLSISLMDVFWESQESELSRLSFMNDNYPVYENALDCSLHLYKITSDKSYLETAFKLMERGKSRLLRERVVEIQNFNNRNIPDSLLMQERQLKSHFAALQSTLETSSQSIGKDTVRNQLFSVGEEIRNWQRKIKKAYPEYTTMPTAKNEMTLADLQKKLNAGAVFVEYFFGSEAVYIISATSKNLCLIKVDADSLNEKISDFTSLLSKGIQGRTLEEDYRNYTHLAYKLYRQLLYPPLVAAGYDEKQTAGDALLIVPDGNLNYLPFHALIRSKPSNQQQVDYKSLDYTALHYAVSYAYDADAHFAPPYKERKGHPGLLAFGWSDGTGNNSKADELPGTYEELNSIARIMPGTFFRGEMAKKKAFMEQASDYNILHLAIHGGADEKNIHKSYLQFSDEKLFHHEMYQLNIKANLTVLSACETGSGKFFSSEGVYSMAHGFAYAGAKSILMTLWEVNDQSTAALIQKFYQNLDNNDPLHKALKNAQVDYLKDADEYAAHPAYWAGFVLWGNHLAIQQNNHPSMMVFVVGSAGILAICLLLLRRMRSKRTHLPSQA